MVIELGVFVIFPSNGSVIRCRPLLGGVPRVGSPASSLLLRHSDFPAPPLRSLALCSAVPRFRGGVGISQVPGEPSHACPALRPRRDPLHQAIRAMPLSGCGDVAFRHPEGVGSRDLPISGLNHTACMLTVYASRPRLPVCCLRPRKTRFRLVAHLGRAGIEPAGFFGEVSALVRYVIASSSPRLGLAHRESGEVHR